METFKAKRFQSAIKSKTEKTKSELINPASKEIKILKRNENGFDFSFSKRQKYHFL